VAKQNDPIKNTFALSPFVFSFFFFQVGALEYHPLVTSITMTII